jgi:hypothetical protein
VNPARLVSVHEILRYAQGANRTDIELDGYLNYHFVTTPLDAGDAPRLMLEAGINPAATLLAPDRSRRPVISLRSSPWKAGHVTNPWHDEFDLDLAIPWNRGHFDLWFAAFGMSAAWWRAGSPWCLPVACWLRVRRDDMYRLRRLRLQVVGGLLSSVA